MREFKHIPIMVNEIIKNFIINKNGRYLDCTFGRGGHAKAILNVLSNTGELTAIDKDLEALESAKNFKDQRFSIHHSSIINFSNSLKKKVLMVFLWILEFLPHRLIMKKEDLVL